MSEGRAPDSNFYFWIAASVSDAAAVNPNGIKMLLANGFNTFFIKGNTFFGNGPKSLPKNSPDCPILCNWVFDKFLLAMNYLQKLCKASKLVY